MSHRISTATKSVYTSASQVPVHRQPTEIGPNNRETKDILARVGAPAKPVAKREVPAQQKSSRKQPSPANQRRIGKYQVAKPLHKGRVSHVMLSKVKGIGGVERSVVIKILRSRFAQEKRFVDGLLHEERVTSSLQHPNIVQLIDSGDSDYGYYIAMEYIKGWNLDEIMRAAKAAKKSIPLDVALSIAHGVASGLHYLHDLLGNRDARVRMVHRDVHPANLMLSDSGFVKLIDFGGVTIEGMDRQSGAMLASVSSYTPPEVTSRRHVDRRGDIYSLGVLLYEMTTGRALLRDDRTGEIVPPSAFSSEYPADLQELILRMVQADPDRRLQSAASLQFAFEELAAKYRLALSHRRVAQFTKRLMEQRRSAGSSPALGPKKQSGHPPRKQPGKPPVVSSMSRLSDVSSANVHKPMQQPSTRHQEHGVSRRPATDLRKTRVHISRQPW